jgi:CheY-like chemotaxis protein
MMPAIQHHSLPRVLIIEDHPFLQKIHEHCLTKIGFETVIASDAETAMALWEEQWDLIFSDIGLPDMNGNDLCKKRRTYEAQLGIHTPSFAYTAYGDTMRDECLAAGFDEFGVKPMRNEELYAALQKLLPNFELYDFKDTK